MLLVLSLALAAPKPTPRRAPVMRRGLASGDAPTRADRARAIAAWFTRAIHICTIETNERVPFQRSITKENIEGLAQTRAFVKDEPAPGDCDSLAKRILGMTPRNVVTTDERLMCAGAAGFSSCLREYKRRERGGARVQPANLTPGDAAR